MTDDGPQGAMGRVQTAGEARVARCLLPTFLWAHIFIESERDVWVRGSYLSLLPLVNSL